MLNFTKIRINWLPLLKLFLFLNTLGLYQNIYILIYFIIYNITVFSLFWVIFLFFKNPLNSNFSFQLFANDIYFKIWLSLILLSLAGLPPLLGFMTKILLISIIIPANSLLIFSFFLLFLFIFLYFYIQNVKIIFSEPNKTSIISSSSFLNRNSFFLFLINLICFLLLTNIFFFDDIVSIIFLVL